MDSFSSLTSTGLNTELLAPLQTGLIFNLNLNLKLREWFGAGRSLFACNGRKTQVILAEGAKKRFSKTNKSTATVDSLLTYLPLFPVP